jgi:hypothetical protein
MTLPIKTPSAAEWRAHGGHPADLRRRLHQPAGSRFLWTEPAIEAAAAAEKMKLIGEVLPRELYDNDLLKDSRQLPPSAGLGLDEAVDGVSGAQERQRHCAGLRSRRAGRLFRKDPPAAWRGRRR